MQENCNDEIIRMDELICSFCNEEMENCNKVIHDEMIRMGEIMCPFCNKEIEEIVSKSRNKCCWKQEIINDDGMQVCRDVDKYTDTILRSRVKSHPC